MIDSSIPAMVYRAMHRSTQGSLWERSDGAWLEYSPQKILEEWDALWRALCDLGIPSEEGIGIIAPSSPRWIIADLAIQTLGAWTVPLFPTLSAETFEFECKDSSTHVLVIRKYSELNSDIQSLVKSFRTIIVMETEEDQPENAISWDSLIEKGRELRQTNESFDRAIQQLHLEQIASIIYTSGSTGRPKGAEILHRNLLFQFDGASQFYPQDPLKGRALSTLPVAHVFERMVVYYYIYSGIPLYFSDDPKNTAQYFKEVKPTIMSMVPRFLEKLHEKLTGSWRDVSGIKKYFVRLAIRHAQRHNPTNAQKPWHLLFDKLVYAKMREGLGGSFELIISGSSALSPTIHRFLVNIGLPIVEGYGLTECSPTLSAGTIRDNKIGTVGKVFPGVELRIGENNEVQIKSLGVMKGYHKNSHATTLCWTADGWFRTGDRGVLDSEGYLTLTGRLKELFKTSTGKYISPLPIEQSLTRHALIEHAVVIAENRKYAVALLFLDHNQARYYLRVKEYDPQKAVRSRRIQARIEQYIRSMNRRFNEWERVKKWVILADILTPESGMLTPTLKVRRHEVESHFTPLLTTLYPDSNKT